MFGMLKNTVNSTVNTVNSTEGKRGRGRPPVYTPEQRAMFSALIASHGVTGTRDILASRNGVVGVSKVEQANARLRKQLGFDKPLSISMPTLLKVAKVSGISLRRGRRVSVVSPAVDGFDGAAANLPTEIK